MDPTLAALIGAGVGSLVTAVSPWLTGRIQHRSRRREVMREAYLQAMRAVAEVPRSRTPEDLQRVKGEMFEARLHIRLVGSRRASATFNELDDITQRWIDGAMKQMSSPRRGNSSANVTDRLQADETLGDVGHANEIFVAAARRDMRMDSVSAYLRRRLRLHSKEE